MNKKWIVARFDRTAHDIEKMGLSRADAVMLARDKNKNADSSTVYHVLLLSEYLRKYRMG